LFIAASTHHAQATKNQSLLLVATEVRLLMVLSAQLIQ
jgi:hypothetical protein